MPEMTWNDAVEEIKSRLDIVDVISKHVILKKRGVNYIGLCPFHNEKTPSFIVSPQKNIYKCFGCGKGGDALTFLMEINGTSYAETIKDLAQQFNIELPKNGSKYDKNKDKKQKAYEALNKAQQFYTDNLFNNKDAKIAYEYLQKRGITDDIIKQYGIGYSPDSFDSLSTHLKEFGDEVLYYAGLTIKREDKPGYYDRFRGRLMIPIFNEKGDAVAFGARKLKDDDSAKYINSSDSEVYNKSKILYGFNFAKDFIRKEDSILIMEGYFDVITAQVNGVTNAVATCGTALTPEHVKLISRFCPSKKIYLAFDTDNAGKNATIRGAEVIMEQFGPLGDIKKFDEINYGLEEDKYSCEIRVVSPPEGKDPDEYIREHGGEKYIEHVKKAPLLIDFRINQVLEQKTPSMTPIEKLNLVKELCPILNEINNNIIKNEYVKLVAVSLRIDEHSLLQELRKVSYTKDVAPQPISPNVTRNVTKSSNLKENSQKNLLSLYLTEEGILNKQLLSETIKDVEFEDKNLGIIKETIDKLSFTVNNVVDLIESLYTYFAEDNEKKEIITDLICLSEVYKDLKNSDFALALTENISIIEKFERKMIKEKLILENKSQQNEENEIEYQKKLVEKLKKLRTGEYKE